MNSYKDKYSYTRKKIRERTPEPEKIKINGSDYMWSSFLREGDILYNYLINNFEELFDGNKIKHFGFRDGLYRGVTNIDEMNDTYSIDIQNELIPWIKKELEENRLFKKELWKPFRDQYSLSDMYLGYRKLFQYKHYYFQLAMETYCDLDECVYCGYTIDKPHYFYEKNSKHIKLAPYGWKNENSNMLQPLCKVEIPSDNIMIERHWTYQ
jgi:hypothetical protein